MTATSLDKLATLTKQRNICEETEICLRLCDVYGSHQIADEVKRFVDTMVCYAERLDDIAKRIGQKDQRTLWGMIAPGGNSYTSVTFYFVEEHGGKLPMVTLVGVRTPDDDDM
jgi:hypothetical protein